MTRYKDKIKVHIFWEGHKILQNLHLTFDCMYCSQKYVRKVKISQNFVAFSEYMNFNKDSEINMTLQSL